LAAERMREVWLCASQAARRLIKVVSNRILIFDLDMLAATVLDGGS
jgi:hypothetical protein